MPGYRRSKRRHGARVASASRPYLSRGAKAEAVGRLLSGSKRRQTTSLASKAKRSKRLRSAVVANAKAIDAVKQREFGYWQTTNSVLTGATEVEHRGEPYRNLHAQAPVLLHLNNLHSHNGVGLGRGETIAAEQHGAAHLLRALPIEAVSEDGLVRLFDRPLTFSVNGVLQKPKRSGPHMYRQAPTTTDDTPGELPQQPPLIPIPNGKKIRWGGVDLQFKIEGALQNTQFDFYIVQCNKEKPMAWDPWHQTVPLAARDVPAVLPYTIKDFDDIHHSMYPKRINTKRYSVLQHRRVFVNNVNRVTGQTGHNHLTPDNAKYALGNTWGHIPDATGPHAYAPTHRATTPASQFLRMSYKPNKIMRPLKNFIGERIDNTVEKRGMFADANPKENATLGTMSWDNFHPSANVWLVMTTNHERIETPQTAEEIQLEHDIWEYPNHTDNTWEKTPTYNTGPSSPAASDGVPLPADENNPDLGKNPRRYYQLIRERMELDEYRNPRIHIFRRTWWQDEHIPTEEGAAYACTDSESKLKPTVTPIVETHAEAKNRTAAEKETLYDQWRNLRRLIHDWRSSDESGLYVTTDNDPQQWSLTSGVGFSGLPASLQNWITQWASLTAVLAWGGLRGDPRNPLDTMVRATRALYHQVRPTPEIRRQWTMQP